MNLRTRRDRVARAQADCATHRQAVAASWQRLQDETGAAATPQRIVVIGLVAGFLFGLPRAGGKGSGSSLTTKLLSVLVDRGFALFGAEFAAGAAMAAAEDEGA